jgi:dTDP-4-amino-4,6-dideoxygalactose transaminase
MSGVVMTSPLACTAALNPIFYSGNKIQFIDIDEDTLNMDCNQLPSIITDKTIAIQATFFGGLPMNMKKLKEYAKKNNLKLIEDCAQGYGSSYEGRNLGSWGDISCFSMIKNSYGISGGVLATDDKEIFDRAEHIQDSFVKEGLLVGFLRSIRNVISTYRTTAFGERLYRIIMRSRPIKDEDFEKNFVRPRNLCFKVFIRQLKYIPHYHKKRKEITEKYINKMAGHYDTVNYSFSKTIDQIPTKLYFYNSDYLSNDLIKDLNIKKIEAMHLQHKYNCYYQDSFSQTVFIENTSWKNCLRFIGVHDKIMSVPLYERITDDDINIIVNLLISQYDRKKNNLV